jgi:hypothetical protein
MKRPLLLALLAAFCACAPPPARLEFDVDAPAVADPEALLRMATSRDQAVRRRASADLAIFLLKKNGVWRENVSPISLSWRIPDERGIRMEMAALRSSRQKPEYALANLCAHCMGMVPVRAWHARPVRVEDEFEGRVCRLAAESPDPAVRVILLVGLQSSKTYAARKTIVVATADPELGVRKSAVFLVDQASGGASGPCGAVGVDSSAADVDYAGKSIRESFGKGWTGRTVPPGEEEIIGDGKP